MTDTGYTITTDPARKLVVVRLFGHWSAATAQAFERDALEKYTAMRAHGVRPGDYLSFVDGSQYQVQTQDTVAIYAGLVTNPDIISRKIALLAPAALARRQARAAPCDNHRFFDSEAEAMAWLLADDD